MENREGEILHLTLHKNKWNVFMSLEKSSLPERVNRHVENGGLSC